MNQIKQGYKQTKVGIIPEDWEITPVGDLFTFKNGLNKEKEFFGTGTPIVNYVDVYKQPYLTKQNIQGLVTVSEKELNNYDVKKGDVFFTRTSETINEIGLTTVILDDLKDTVFSGFVLRGRPKNKKLNDNFKKYCFSTFKARKEIIRKSSMTTRALTNGTLLSEVLIITPPLKEQEKIAEILTIWDEAITKQTELLRAKELQKKGLMQKLLSGEVRFGGFDNEWEEVRLGEIVKKMQSGGTPKADNQEFYNGNIPFVKVNDITSSGKYLIKTESSITEKGLKNSSAWIVPINSIIYSMYASVGFLSINTIEVATSQAMINIILDLEKANLEYIYYHLLDFKKNVHTYVETGTQGNLNAQTVRNLKIKLPSLPEQQKIAEVLSLADDEINLLKNELEELKQQKKALMQKLLTGQVRVKV